MGKFLTYIGQSYKIYVFSLLGLTTPKQDVGYGGEQP